MISSWASGWPQIRILAERNPREVSIANVPDVLLPTSVLGCFYSTNADDTTLMAESKEELKSLLMKVKEEGEKAGLKLSIHKTKIMASSPITSWQIDGETMNFIFLGSKITADGACSYKIKGRLLFGRKSMTNLDSILKNRDFALPTKGRLVNAMVFPVVMYGCENWTIKKAEC